MKRLAGIMAAALLLAAGGQATVWAQGGKTPKIAAVPLSVEIVNDGSTRITADGPFIDGVGGTRANLDPYGNLIIAFGQLVQFQYGDPLPGTRSSAVTDEPVSGWHSGAYISTLNRTGEPPLQRLARGASQCIKLNWQYDHPAGGWWRHGYNRGFDQKENGTSYAVFTRVDTDAEVWTVEPLGGQACGFTNLESTAAVFTQRTVKGRWVYPDYGDYILPFKLTLTRKP